MKRALSLLTSTVLILLISCSFVSATSNLIDNSGFEDGLDSWHENSWWSVYHDVDIETNPSIVKAGSNSLKLSVEGVVPGILNYCDGGTYEPNRGVAAVRTDDVILLEPNTEYEMRSWVRLDKDASVNTYAATMLIVLYKTNPEWDVNVGSCNQTVTPGVRISYPIYATDLNANEWTEISRTFETNDENLYARLWLIVGIQKGLNETATAWFDDVELIEKEDDGDGKKDKKHKVLIGVCEPYWQCSGWSECSNGAMTRQCQDINMCDFVYNKPIEATGCELEAVSLGDTGAADISKPNYLLWLLIGIAILLILMLIVLALR